jgi:hypothetical protein
MSNFVSGQVLTAAALNSAFTSELSLTGGTMTGALVLYGDPTTGLQAATKQYVDATKQMAATTIRGNSTGATANATDLSVSAVMTMLGAAPLNSPSFTGTVRLAGSIGVNGAAAPAKPTVAGAKGGNAALASLIAALVSYGFITDSTTA